MDILCPRFRGKLDQVLLKLLKNHAAALWRDRHKRLTRPEGESNREMKIQPYRGKGNPEKLCHFNILLTGFCYGGHEWPCLPHAGLICLVRNLLKRRRLVNPLQPAGRPQRCFAAPVAKSATSSSNSLCSCAA